MILSDLNSQITKNITFFTLKYKNLNNAWFFYLTARHIFIINLKNTQTLTNNNILNFLKKKINKKFKTSRHSFKYSFFKKFKFNNILKVILNRKNLRLIKTKPIINNPTYLTFFNYVNDFNKRWKFLVGPLLSSMHWELFYTRVTQANIKSLTIKKQFVKKKLRVKKSYINSKFTKLNFFKNYLFLTKFDLNPLNCNYTPYISLKNKKNSENLHNNPYFFFNRPFSYSKTPTKTSSFTQNLYKFLLKTRISLLKNKKTRVYKFSTYFIKNTKWFNFFLKPNLKNLKIKPMVVNNEKFNKTSRLLPRINCAILNKLNYNMFSYCNGFKLLKADSVLSNYPITQYLKKKLEINQFLSFNKNIFFMNKYKNSFLYKKYSYGANLSNYKNLKNLKFVKLFKLPIFFSKYKVNFILHFSGFLFINSYSNLAANKYSFNNLNRIFLKKNMFSFSYKNDIHNLIIQRYIKSNNFLFPNDSTIKQMRTNTSKNLSKNFLTCNNYSINKMGIRFCDKLESFDFLHNKTTSVSANYLDFAFTKAYDEFNRDNDFSIKRIKFKPGYQTLWRDARTVLKKSINVSFKYQHRLTKYLYKYTKFNKFNFLLTLEMRLLNVLKRSRLLPNEEMCFVFLNNNNVFLNGCCINNQYTQIFVNDFVQLVVSIKYYIAYKWLFNISLKKKIQLKNKLKTKTSTVLKLDEKQKSFLLPDWILFNKELVGDVVKYLEIDHLTLSIFVIYEPFLLEDLNVYNFYSIKFGVMSLYNWKYIT